LLLSNKNGFKVTQVPLHRLGHPAQQLDNSEGSFLGGKVIPLEVHQTKQQIFW